MLTVGNLTNIWFLKSGLDALAANQGKDIVVAYRTTVASVPDSGLIENTAYVKPGMTPSQGGSVPTTPTTPTGPGGTDTPSNTVTSKFGLIEITKLGQTGTSTTTSLSGAVFDVYVSKSTYNETTKTWEPNCSAADLANETPVDTFTTGADGIGYSEPLRLSNWYNDGVKKTKDGLWMSGGQYADAYGWRAYCLVETTAPEGYQCSIPLPPPSTTTSSSRSSRSSTTTTSSRSPPPTCPGIWPAPGPTTPR